MDAPKQMQSNSILGKCSIQTEDGTSHTVDLSVCVGSALPRKCVLSG